MTKAKIENIIKEEKLKGDKGDFTKYTVFAGGQVYICFSDRVKDLVGTEVEFEVKEKEYKGNIDKVMTLPKIGGQGFGNKGGGGWKGKSPEELLQARETMTMAYHAQVVSALVSQGVIKSSKEAFDTMRREYHQTMQAYKGSVPQKKSTPDFGDPPEPFEN